jgi:phosphate transport system substrate-binding protein
MRIRAFLILALLALPLSTQAATQTLRIHGSNTVGAKLAPELISAWLMQEGYDKLSIQSQHDQHSLTAENSQGDRIQVEIVAKGSSTGFRALMNGEADIGMSSRRIRTREAEQLSSLGSMTSLESEYVIALDGIAVIIHPDNPIDSLSKAQIREIFSGEIKDWKEVGGPAGAIRLHARDDQSGTFDVFRALVLGKGQTLAAGAKRYIDNAELSAVVANDPLGIGFVGLPYILNAKALAISDGEAPAITPNRFSVATEDYALSRRLYLYIPDTAHATPLASSLIEFALSATAQRAIAKTGFIDQAVFLSTDRIASHYPEEMRQLAQDANRLSVNMRFAEKSVYLDNKAKRDADRIYSFLAESGRMKNGLLLFGFAEKKPGGLNLTTLNRSVRRADQVAKYLRDKGVYVVTSRGYGAAVPVAANDTQFGQAKNRRVELWIK